MVNHGCPIVWLHIVCLCGPICMTSNIHWNVLEQTKCFLVCLNTWIVIKRKNLSRVRDFIKMPENSQKNNFGFHDICMNKSIAETLFSFEFLFRFISCFIMAAFFKENLMNWLTLLDKINSNRFSFQVRAVIEIKGFYFHLIWQQEKGISGNSEKGN